MTRAKISVLVASLAFGLLVGMSPEAMAWVSNLGTPTCHGHNPSPDVVQGLFYFTLPESDGDQHDTVNPWKQFGSPRGATYSALKPIPGDVNDNTTIVRFDFDKLGEKPQKMMTLVWGTPGSPNTIRFFSVDRVHHTRVKVAEITGDEVISAFGDQTVYMSIAMPAGTTYNQAVFVTSGHAPFTFANLNVRCKQ